MQTHLSGDLNITVQSSLSFDDANVPEPDLAVVAFNPLVEDRELRGSDIRLVAEVGVSALRSDERDKVALYALARIPEYWTLDPVAMNPLGAARPGG